MIEWDIALVDKLRNKPAEGGYVEFKKDNSDPKIIGKLGSALSNTARIDGLDLAYVLWGIEDGSHEIIGTSFVPEAKKVGNQVFEFWLAQQLNPSVPCFFRTVEHPDGRVVLLEIPAATSAPVEFGGIAYVRIGSATPRLSEYPDYFQKLIDNIRPYTWEKNIALSFLTEDKVLELLDYPVYFSGSSAESVGELRLG